MQSYKPPPTFFASPLQRVLGLNLFDAITLSCEDEVMPRWFLLICCGWISSIAPLYAAEPVHLCVGDGNPWPPYSYFERDAQGFVDPATLNGIATQQVRQALAQAGWNYQLSFMPWARIMQEMEATLGQCDLVWNASYSEARARFALFSEVQYHTQLVLFSITPSGQEEQQNEIQNATYCGVNGYNYQPFGLSNEALVLGDSIQQVLSMLEAQRCQFFPSEKEPLLSGGELGIYQLPSGLTYHPLERTKAFHVMVSRRHPQATILLDVINQAITDHPLDEAISFKNPT